METQVGSGPGAVPDGGVVPGPPLTVGKGLGGTLDLAWSASCSGLANSYAVYEGTLPIVGAYNHTPLKCDLGDVTTANIAPAAGNTYYLVVPETAFSEGSQGRGLIAGDAQETPQGAGACHPQRLSFCP